jgi:hypothetical protein
MQNKISLLKKYSNKESVVNSSSLVHNNNNNPSSLNKSISIISNSKNLSNLPLIELTNKNSHINNHSPNHYLESFTQNITENYNSPHNKQNYQINKLSLSPLIINKNLNNNNNLLTTNNNDVISNYISSFQSKHFKNKLDLESNISKNPIYKNEKSKKSNKNFDNNSKNFKEKLKDFNNLSFESKFPIDFKFDMQSNLNNNKKLETNDDINNYIKNQKTENIFKSYLKKEEIKENQNLYKSNFKPISKSNKTNKTNKTETTTFNNINHNCKFSSKKNSQNFQNCEFNSNFNSNDFLKTKKQNFDEEKITARSKSDFAEGDNFLFLKKRFEGEREALSLISAQIQASKHKQEKERTVSKNLLGFSERKIKHILDLFDFFILFLVLSDVFLSAYINARFTSAEYDRNDRLVKDRFSADKDIRNMRIAVIVIICLMEFLLIIKYCFKLKFLRMRSIASSNDGIFTSGLCKKLLAEMLLLLPFTPPQANDLIQGSLLFGKFTYSLDSIILLSKIFKLYYFFIVISNFSIWLNEKAKDIAYMAKAAIGYLFAIKAIIRKNPIFLIFFAFIFCTIIFGFLVKIFEFGFIQETEKIRVNKNHGINKSNFNTNNDKGNSFFVSYWDVFWLIAMTMTTVGFGDIYPETHLGRLVCFIAGVIGLVIISLVIVRFGMMLELGEKEKNAFLVIKAKEHVDEVNEKAKELIKVLFALRRIKMKKKEGGITNAIK